MDADEKVRENLEASGYRVQHGTWRSPTGGLKLDPQMVRAVDAAKPQDARLARKCSPPRTRARSNCTGARRRPGTRRTSRSSSSSSSGADPDSEGRALGPHPRQSQLNGATANPAGLPRICDRAAA